MAVFQNPIPPVFIGGAQPYAPRQLVPQIGERPPLPSWPARHVNMMAAVFAAQPDPWARFELGAAGGLEPYAPRQLNPSILNLAPPAVNNPPFQYAGPYTIKAELVALWQPDPWVFDYYGPAAGLQPYAPRLLNPSIIAVPVNNPPFGYPVNLANMTAGIFTAQPDPWVRIEVGAVSGLGPYGQNQLSPGIPGQSIDPPPFVHRERTIPLNAEIVGRWQPDPWVYAYQGPPLGSQPYGYRQLTPPTPPSVDNPPFAYPDRLGQFAATFASIRVYWAPDPWSWAEQGGGGAMSDQPYGPRSPVRAVFLPILGTGKRKPLFVEPSGGFPGSYWPDGNG